VGIEKKVIEGCAKSGKPMSRGDGNHLIGWELGGISDGFERIKNNARDAIGI
jgi:hypothetical protein